MWFRKNRPRRAIFRHFKKCDDGVTAIEFALVAGPFLFLLAVIFETGLMLFSEYVIENGVAQAARMIRTGEVQNSGMTKSEFKDVVCGNLATFLNCQANLYVDVRNFPNFAAISLPNPIAGNQLSPDVTTGAQFNPGPRLTVTVVRTYYEWNLFVPGISLLANIGTDKRLLSAGAVFRNEPF
jgi:Flp pilus assembly protein TadG